MGSRFWEIKNRIVATIPPVERFDRGNCVPAHATAICHASEIGSMEEKHPVQARRSAIKMRSRRLGHVREVPEAAVRRTELTQACLGVHGVLLDLLSKKSRDIEISSATGGLAHNFDLAWVFRGWPRGKSVSCKIVQCAFGLSSLRGGHFLEFQADLGSLRRKISGAAAGSHHPCRAPAAFLVDPAGQPQY
jgi:hypothetical protein